MYTKRTAVWKGIQATPIEVHINSSKKSFRTSHEGGEAGKEFRVFCLLICAFICYHAEIVRNANRMSLPQNERKPMSRGKIREMAPKGMRGSPSDIPDNNCCFLDKLWFPAYASTNPGHDYGNGRGHVCLFR